MKLYNKVPENGLVLYCGTVLTDDGKEKKVNIDFEPFKPINTSLYLCDNKFHTEALNELLEDDAVYGFIVMDGNGCLFGTLCGNTRNVLHKITVELPKKHGRGGQSAVRFARLRLEKRHNYLRRVAELSTQIFISNDKPNINGLVLAGSAEFKEQLNQSDLFDQRLKPLVVAVLDVSYGGENGFNQAIDLAADTLQNVKFITEKKLITKYFEEINQDSGKFCFGVKNTMKALEMSSIDILIVWENLTINRYEFYNSTTQKNEVKIMNEHEEQDQSNFKDPTSGSELEIKEKIPLIEWLANHYREFGAQLEIVTNKSQEGSQFCKGFGGIGALLRWKVDFIEMEDYEAGDDEYDDFI